MNTYIGGHPDLSFDPPFFTFDDETREHLTVLELGSGTGVVAAQCIQTLSNRKPVASAKAATVIVTDLPEVCPLLEKNLSKDAATSSLGGTSQAGAPQCELLIRPLAWGCHAHVAAIFEELVERQRRGHGSSGMPIVLLPPDTGPNIISHIVCSDLVRTTIFAPSLRLHPTPPLHSCLFVHTYITPLACLFVYLSANHLLAQVYFPELLAPLLRTLLELSSPPFVSRSTDPQRWPKIIISYKTRSLSKETPFWSTFGLWFSFSPVLVRTSKPKPKLTPAERTRWSDVSNDDDARDGGEEEDESDVWTRFGAEDDGDVFVFVARRRKESLDWDVPLDDAELLSGVGAGGDGLRKSDDTFETLLLMSLSS